ncbi:hypothetical protein [Salibacterium halotolerans]|uniref:Uncharacterized protein n=1 Tax=Salibacterium halotolerans TaxID=1884432 RepID=A0A1I5PGX2_9BACI|nr:hypothetical protein [Salibacterium halotolerans]SFP33358.1 hypothetical protein SAMN05518683_104125 [Salibacterium halotolerans]
MLCIGQSRFLLCTVFTLVLSGTFSGGASAQDLYEVDLPEDEFKKVAVEQLQLSHVQKDSFSFSSDYTFIHNNGDKMDPQKVSALIEGKVGYNDDGNLIGIGISYGGKKTDFFFSNVSEDEYNKAAQESLSGESSESPMNHALKKAERFAERLNYHSNFNEKQGVQTTDKPFWDGHEYNDSDILDGILNSTAPLGLRDFLLGVSGDWKISNAERSEDSEW